MAACDSCGRDHGAEGVLMDNDIVKLLGAYDGEIESVIDKILADEALGDDHRQRRNMRVSFINTIAAKMVARAALLDLEHKEEKHPELQHVEQLNAAFASAFNDLHERLVGMFAEVMLSGDVPDLVRAKEALDRDIAESATVH